MKFNIHIILFISLLVMDLFKSDMIVPAFSVIQKDGNILSKQIQIKNR